MLLDYNKVHPKGELATICCRSNRLRRCESFVLESALVFRELVGHVAHYTIILAIPLCSWTYILRFNLFGIIVKECPPLVIKEIRSHQKMTPTMTTLLFPAMVRVVINENACLHGRYRPWHQRIAFDCHGKQHNV